MKETLEKIKGKIRLDNRYLSYGIVAGVLIAIILIWTLVAKVFVPGNRYNGAQALMASGKFQQAMEAFTALGSFRDSADCAKESQYAYGCQLLEQGLYTEATAQFKALGDYSDARDKISQVRYAAADELLQEGKYDEAASAFYALGGYGDAADRILAARYDKGESLLALGKFDEA